MAGSYDHIVDPDGGLDEPHIIGTMLDTWSGDVTECVTQMYGMIWYLAEQLALETAQFSQNQAERLQRFIEEAKQNYKEGLSASPTWRFQRENSE